MSKKHCFQHLSRFSFSHFSINSYSDRSPSEILGPLPSRSETKLKGWSLNTEEVRCQLPPTLRDQIRFPTGTCLLPISLIYFYQESSDTSSQSQLRSPAHAHWDLHSHWSSFFSIPRNPGSIVLSCTEKPRG